MGIRRLLHNNVLRGAVMLGVIGLATTACSGIGSGTFSDQLTGNQVKFTVFCTSRNAGTCTGRGQGVIGGKTFDTKTIYLTGGTQCSTNRCVGGFAYVGGTATYGGASVRFSAQASDNDPSPSDTLHLNISTTPPTEADFACSNGCFTLITSAKG